MASHRRVIGFADEALICGYVVNTMRSAGHSKVSVALVSSALFALLYLVLVDDRPWHSGSASLLARLTRATRARG